MTVAVNQGLRLARGEHGQIVVTAAFCGRCNREVMPTDHGTCIWCGHLIVDEDLLPAKRLLEQLANGDTTYSAGQDDAEPEQDEEEQAYQDARELDDAEEELADVIAADVDDFLEGSGREPQAHAGAVQGEVSLDTAGQAATSSRPDRRRRVTHDPADVKAALLRFHDEHGREPTFADIKTCDYLPRSAAAIVWRDVALSLGWTDPTAPKRAPRRRASAASRSASSDVEKQEERRESVAGSSNGRTPASDAGDEGSSPSPATRLVGFTRDELWTLYDLALPHTELRSKLRRAIEAAA